MIYPTCGHSVENITDCYSIWIKGQTLEGEKGLNFISVCAVCLEEYRQTGNLFSNYEAAYNWLICNDIN